MVDEAHRIILSYIEDKRGYIVCLLISLNTIGVQMALATAVESRALMFRETLLLITKGRKKMQMLERVGDATRSTQQCGRIVSPPQLKQHA